MLEEINVPGAAMASIRLGLRPCHVFTHVKSRITGFDAFIPFYASMFNQLPDGAIAVHTRANNAVVANPVIVNPCDLASFVWCMYELNVNLNAYTVTADSAAVQPSTPAEIGRLIHDWMIYDKQLSETDAIRLATARLYDPDFADAIRAVRPLFWEAFGAVRIGISPIPPLGEIYILVVDDTPWIPPSQKVSTLDTELTQ